MIVYNHKLDDYKPYNYMYIISSSPQESYRHYPQYKETEAQASK